MNQAPEEKHAIDSDAIRINLSDVCSSSPPLTRFNPKKGTTTLKQQ